jgi:hypothetical protein
MTGMRFSPGRPLTPPLSTLSPEYRGEGVFAWLKLRLRHPT